MRSCSKHLRPQCLWLEGVIPFLQSFRCLSTAVVTITLDISPSIELSGARENLERKRFSSLSLTFRGSLFHFSEQKEESTLTLVLYSGFLVISIYLKYFLPLYFCQSVCLYLNRISFRCPIIDSHFYPF